MPATVSKTSLGKSRPILFNKRKDRTVLAAVFFYTAGNLERWQFQDSLNDRGKTVGSSNALTRLPICEIMIA